ncbi:MAG TPA: hypothetical protein VM368_04195 [Flavisolibacter sp.]|nr:hypothetical protein [Flavisolibacter sp.]
MPESRKRPGHNFQKPSDIPSKQRTKGRILWAILMAIFALIIAFFATGDNLVVLGISASFGAIIGYIIGKNMEQAAKK